VISFGVGPATLAFAAGMRGGWDLDVLIYFVCCGMSRLARFNVIAESPPPAATAARSRTSKARRSPPACC
jgi:phosphatidylserine synthase